MKLNEADNWPARHHFSAQAGWGFQNSLQKLLIGLGRAPISVKCSASQIVAKIGVIVASLVNIVYSDRRATDMTILRRE
jgi:hypothetical protein